VSPSLLLQFLSDRPDVNSRFQSDSKCELSESDTDGSSSVASKLATEGLGFELITLDDFFADPVFLFLPLPPLLSDELLFIGLGGLDFRILPPISTS
jgi:hypothetical protein